MAPWQLWLVGGLALLITEVFAPGFWLINVAVGAFAASAVAFLTIGTTGQILVFAGVTVVSAMVFRPFLLRHLHQKPTVRTNADALVGKGGIVTARIDPATRSGRVSIEGEDWRGATIDGSALEPGTRVTVVEVDGTTLKVDREEDL